MNEFECISGYGFDQGAAQISAGDAQLPFIEVNLLQNRINCEDGLDIGPFEGSFSADDPPKDVARVFTLRLVGILKYTQCDPLIPNSP